MHLHATLARNCVGQATFEMLCGLFIMVPCLLIFIDLATVYQGFCLNSAACIEAAKSAASGPPDMMCPGAPQQRAELAIRRYMTESKVFQFCSDCIVTENLTQPLPSAPLGGAFDGVVTVQTTLGVRPPFIISHLVPKSGFTLTTKKSFPYTYTMPATKIDANTASSTGASL